MNPFDRAQSISKPNRRTVLVGAIASALVDPAKTKAVELSAGLKQHAARCGMMYGCEITESEIASTADLRAAVIREAAIIVPGIAMKWGVVQPQPGPPNYVNADKIASFAVANGLALRGHTAVWYQNLPQWAAKKIIEPGGRDLLLKHVFDVIRHFRGKVVEWDVINEAIYPPDGLPGGLRNSVFYRAAGPNYIADCFHMAHEADPAALLFYNDYGLEYLTDLEQQWRASTLELLTSLKKNGVPIHGLGIQCHLKVGNRFDAKIFRRFLKEVAALGLHISLTEFDIDDQRLPADPAVRDRAIADHARRFLDIAFDEHAVRRLLTWGISDRVTWLNQARPRIDKAKHRALPLDEHMARKPLWFAIADAFDNAPMRI
jgi:endo-1,4-beta-xylanase